MTGRRSKAQKNALALLFCLASISSNPKFDAICQKLTPDTVMLILMISKSNAGTRGSRSAIGLPSHAKISSRVRTKALVQCSEDCRGALRVKNKAIEGANSCEDPCDEAIKVMARQMEEIRQILVVNNLTFPMNRVGEASSKVRAGRSDDLARGDPKDNKT